MITGTMCVFNYLQQERQSVSEQGVIFASARTRLPQETRKSETKNFEYQRGTASDDETSVKRHKVVFDL